MIREWHSVDEKPHSPTYSWSALVQNTQAPSLWLGLRMGPPQPRKHPQTSLQPPYSGLKPQPILCPCFLLWPQPGFSETALKRYISRGKLCLGSQRWKKTILGALLRKDYGYKKGKAFQMKNQNNLKIRWHQKMAVCSTSWASWNGKARLLPIHIHALCFSSWLTSASYFSFSLTLF